MKSWFPFTCPLQQRINIFDLVTVIHLFINKPAELSETVALQMPNRFLQIVNSGKIKVVF